MEAKDQPSGSFLRHCFPFFLGWGSLRGLELANVVSVASDTSVPVDNMYASL